MPDNWKNDYKGYGFTVHSSGSPAPPFAGHFSVTRTTGGQIEIVHHAQLVETFATDHAAQAAATMAAKAFIDSLPGVNAT